MEKKRVVIGRIYFIASIISPEDNSFERQLQVMQYANCTPQSYIYNKINITFTRCDF